MIQSTIYLVEDGQDCIACNKRNEAKQITRQWCEAYMMDYDENERKKMQFIAKIYLMHLVYVLIDKQYILCV